MSNKKYDRERAELVGERDRLIESYELEEIDNAELARLLNPVRMRLNELFEGKKEISWSSGK